MLTDSEIELAHPDAFDFAFGNLPAAKSAEFSGHLSGCVHCQRVVEEYSDIGGIIKSLPPHVEPSAGLEDRAVAAMVAAMSDQQASADRQSDAEDHAATRVYPILERPPAAEPVTRVESFPEVHYPAEPKTWFPRSPEQPPAPQPQSRATLTRRRRRRRRTRLLVAAVAAAVAIVVAIVVPLSLGGGRIIPTQAAVVVPLHVTAAGKAAGYGAATGEAVARQGPSGSWNIT
jgi:hypothetical protein